MISQFDAKDLKITLQQGITELDLALPDDSMDQLIKYLHLLWKWNDAYNLTAIRDPVDMVTKHLLDSLTIANYLHGDRVVDVGTGAGLPGIPLAIYYPNKAFTLIDSAGKKTRFLTQVKHELELKNIEIQNVRIEAFQSPTGFDSILSRAFASINEFLTKTCHLCGKDGRFLAMKGTYPQEELNNLPKGFKVVNVYPTHLKSLGSRHIVELVTD